MQEEMEKSGVGEGVPHEMEAPAADFSGGVASPSKDVQSSVAPNATRALNALPKALGDKSNILSAYRPPMMIGGASRKSLWDKVGLSQVKDYIFSFRLAAYLVSNWYSTTEKALAHFNKKHGSFGEFGTVANKKFSALETPIFFALTVAAFIIDRKYYRNNLGAAIAAERGVAEESISLLNIVRTKNPVITQDMQRFTFQNIVRTLSDFSFVVNLKVGLTFQAPRIVFERSAAMQKTPYQELVIALDEIQNAGMDWKKKEGLVILFGKTLQNCRGFSATQCEELKPWVEHLAQAVIDKKAGINEVVYILGNVLSPGKRFHREYDAVLDPSRGLAAIARYRAKFGNDGIEAYFEKGLPGKAVSTSHAEQAVPVEASVKREAASPAPPPSSKDQIIAKGRDSARLTPKSENKAALSFR